MGAPRPAAAGGAADAAAAAHMPTHNPFPPPFHGLLQGYITPTPPPGASAAVLAIFSSSRSLQFVAFSADVRRSLVTLLGRRPDKAYYYK